VVCGRTFKQQRHQQPQLPGNLPAHLLDLGGVLGCLDAAGVDQHIAAALHLLLDLCQEILTRRACEVVWDKLFVLQRYTDAAVSCAVLQLPLCDRVQAATEHQERGLDTGQADGFPLKPQEGRQRRCKSRTATQDFQAIRALQFRANVLEVHGVLGVADDDLLTILRWRRQIAGLAGDDLCPTVFEKVFYVGGADRLKGIFPEHTLIDWYAVDVLDAAPCQAIHPGQRRCIVRSRRTAGVQCRLEHRADIASQPGICFDINGVSPAAQRLLHEL